MPTITFTPKTPALTGLFDPPILALEALPEWLKKIEPYFNGNSPIYNDHGVSNGTIKRCMPVFDMMTAGYFITAPADVYFEDGISTQWSVLDFNLVGSHSNEQFSTIPFDKNQYEEHAFKWNNPWVIKTPEGYSTLFIHPSRETNDPFKCFSGIVDTDTHPTAINFPFLIRKGFTGIVKAGTPIIQVIPFKREPWTLEINEFNKDLDLEWKRAMRYLNNRYKNLFRAPKSFS
jgi:hypothetical protein